MVHEFEKSLKTGEIGQNLFLSYFPVYRDISDGHGTDFIHQDGSTLELKTETRSLFATPNFFVERYSDFNKKTPGGPWQALEKKSDRFAWLFLPNKKLFIFKTVELVAALEGMLQKQALILSPGNIPNHLKMIPNKTYTTAGWAIKRSNLISKIKCIEIDLTKVRK